MNRRKRTEILIKSKNNTAESLVKSIETKYDLRKITDPNNGLVMIKVRESAKKQLFYLGEVIVTEAKVQINNSIGKGIVIGDNENLARNLAIIDACYMENIPETKLWDEILIEENEEILKDEIKNEKEVLKTKVNFESMV